MDINDITLQATDRISSGPRLSKKGVDSERNYIEAQKLMEA